jgi:hypothetical protein
VSPSDLEGGEGEREGMGVGAAFKLVKQMKKQKKNRYDVEKPKKNTDTFMVKRRDVFGTDILGRLTNVLSNYDVPSCCQTGPNAQPVPLWYDLAPMHTLHSLGSSFCKIFVLNIYSALLALALRNLTVLISTCLESRYQLAKIQLAQFFSTVLISTCLDIAADSKTAAHSSENCLRRRRRSVSTVLISAAAAADRSQSQISAAHPKIHFFLSHALVLTSNKYYFEV